MNCAEFSAALSELPCASAEAHAHAERCSGCRALLVADGRLRALEPRPVMSNELRAALSKSRSRGRAKSAWSRALLPTAVVVAAWGSIVLAARRPDLTDASATVVVGATLGFLGPFAIGLTLLLSRNRSGECARPTLRYGFLAFAMLAYASVALIEVAHLSGPQPPRVFQAWIGEHLVPVLGNWTRHLPCTLLGLFVGAAVLAAVLLAAARSVIVAPRLGGAVGGAAAAMATGFVLFAFCSSHAIAHVAFVHAIPLLLIPWFGAQCGKRVLAP